MLGPLKKLLPYLALLTSIFLAIIVVPEAIKGIEIASDVEHYRSTRAEVITQYEKKHKKGPSSYIIEFNYKVAGRNYRGSNDASSWTDSKESIHDLVRKEKKGSSTILVFYDPQHPRRVAIHKDIPIWPHIIWIVGTILIFLFSLIFLIFSFQRQRYLKKSHARLEEMRKRSKKGSEEKAF